jgi:Lrp/AsnC family transcriptional regulator for asnA, asnC and gidA
MLDSVCENLYNNCRNRQKYNKIMSEIDKIDLDIVDYLMQDGRMTSSEIARKIGNVSERSVRYRIDRLLREGVIKISAIADPRAIGFMVVADVFLEVESDSIINVAKEMTKYECISYVACAIGESDVSVQVVGRDNDEIYRFVTDVIGKVPGVRKTTTSIVPMVLKDIYQWRIPKSICTDGKYKSR